MEQKTAEEFLNEMLENEIPEELNWEDMTIIAMNKFANYKAKQQQEIAVDKALEMCSSLSKEMIYDRDNLTKEESKGLILRNFQVCYATSKQEILSLKPEILKELEK